ncbi:sensor histidine kinase [Streptomyces sp. WAC05374]|uniref:sensor histidine kinase n=1 Tax=Streptomyces sp. WAC05374 TaxID=2487420 RepID=UPI000F897B39|nr:sensor histidine kinase [Streptomyces sp. WAC05374]RST15899.1 sensor histidine kinase [Streptomyces sp. WAC05374]TDF54525.1 sensor histidine kinase [Streptomyces sp. WAC05374]TDF56160.1 sensor histidine kinase [Streptomyces sp. WAC05374]
MPIRPFAADVLITAALTSVAVLLGQEAAGQGWPALDLAGYLLVGLVNVPVVARGRAPVAVCLFVLALWSVYVTAGYWPVVNSFAPMLALYTVASLRPLRTATACAVLMSAVWIYAGFVSDRGSMPSVIGQALGFSLVLVRFGHLARRSAELARKLREEQEERARREVAEERGRIARELHDVVAHHMSVISVQVGLARFVFDSDPATARTALGTIAGTSTEALEELRRVLQVLRADEDGDPAAPMPGLARLAETIERVRAGGVAVELRVDGTPRPLPPGVDLCAYRVVQEALTNVLKHAPGAAAVVEVHYRPHHVAVSVTDDGRGVIQDRVRTGGGHGLIGMRERAKLYGGTISVGPRSEGGFAVRLTLPTSTATALQGDGTSE